MKILPIGDLHLSEKAPVSRTDEDWVQTQLDKLNWIVALANENDALLLVVGDIFDKWKVSLKLASKVGEVFCKAKYKPLTIPGNHDLPAHSFESMEDCAYHNLVAHNVIYNAAHSEYVFNSYSFYGEAFGFFEFTRKEKINKDTKKNILLLHELVWNEEKPFPGAPEKGNASQVLSKYDSMDLIIAGDNHQPFTVKTSQGRCLVNVGSMTRRSAKQKDYKPYVYIIDLQTDDMEKHYIPIKDSSIVFDSSHIEEKHKKEDTINSFIEKLDDEFEIQDTLLASAKEYFKKHKTNKEVQNIILKAMEM